MPLVDRADSTLVVVDAQRVFFDQPSMTDEERAQGAAALERLRWLAGLAALLEVPAVVVEEGPQRNGSTDEQLLERLPPGTAVFSKETFSLVAEHGAVAAIRDTGRRTAVVGGFRDRHVRRPVGDPAARPRLPGRRPGGRRVHHR